MLRRVCVLLLVSATARAAPACAQAPAFVPGPPVVVGAGSGEVVLADLDRDGHVDVLTKHLLGRRLSVRLGDGRGRFVAGGDSVTTFPFQPGTIALGDVDRDGILDLGVAWRDSVAEHVHVYRGTGTGGFAAVPGASYRTNAIMETYKPWLRFADVDADGDLDIITANGRRNTIEVLLGDGRGRFGPPHSDTIGPAHDRYWFDAGDVDGDGFLDVVAVSSAQPAAGPARITVLRGAASGVFTARPGASPAVAGVPRGVTVAHVNDDRRLDVVIAHGDGQISVLFNAGDGAFTLAPGSPHRVGGDAFAIAVADMNADERPDLVAATVNSITVLIGGKQGLVAAAGSPFPAGPGAYNVAVGDVDGDGKPDIVASSFEGDRLTVLRGR